MAEKSIDATIIDWLIEHGDDEDTAWVMWRQLQKELATNSYQIVKITKTVRKPFVIED